MKAIGQIILQRRPSPFAEGSYGGVAGLDGLDKQEPSGEF
jgi:hypothetical protein